MNWFPTRQILEPVLLLCFWNAFKEKYCWIWFENVPKCSSEHIWIDIYSDVLYQTYVNFLKNKFPLNIIQGKYDKYDTLTVISFTCLWCSRWRYRSLTGSELHAPGPRRLLRVTLFFRRSLQCSCLIQAGSICQSQREVFRSAQFICLKFEKV